VRQAGVSGDMRRLVPAGLAVQGTFYVLTGMWPLVSMRTFEAVTGPKVDDWLVHMVGLLAAVIGVVLLVALRSGRVTSELLLLSGGAATAFAAIDLRYGLEGRISPIYLADAAAELMFLAIAGLAWRDRPR
jgi:energy-converting hydrogenase Eha subunit E